jgi:hypothetical protein
MRALLRTVLPLACLSVVACSGSDFELGTAEDSGSSTVEDTDGQNPEDVGGATDGNTGARDSGAADTQPPCNTALPPLACATPGSNYAAQFQHNGDTALAHLVDHNTSHAISYVTARAGRHEKMILRLRRGSGAGPNVGTVTLTAFYTPCPGVHVPLGKSRSFPANNVDGDVSFYFNDTATFLPLFPAGTRLTFVLTTDSTLYSFELLGNATNADAPPSLQWFVKKGSGAWESASPAAPAAQAWLRDCPG